MSFCKEPMCGRVIDWARTERGARVPVDHDSAGAPDGNLAVWREDGTLRCRVLRAGEGPGPGQLRGRPHWATCTAPGRFRPGG